ncbi:MAG TPA: Gldg family protein [Polyangiaceae bacterium]
MALNNPQGPIQSTPPERRPSAVSGSPIWTAPLFFLGLFLVFLGERVLVTTTVARALSSVLGLGAIVASTIVRWGLGARAGGERARIERLLGAAQLLAILAVAVALSTTNIGAKFLGLESIDAATRERLDMTLLVTWVTLLLSGVLPLIFAESALVPMRRAPQPESRRVYAAATAGLALALALSYLGLFVASGQKWGVAADFAYFKTAKPSSSTLRIAGSLKEPIRVVAFYPAVNEVKNEVDRYMREVARASSKVKFEFVDRVLSPKVAREMRVAQDGTIVLSRGEVRQVMSLGTEMKSARATLRNLDQEFQKNLMKLARDSRVAYLTTGHHELNDRTPGSDPDKDKGVAGLRKLLEMQNYRVVDLGMPQGLANEIPDDGSVVLVLGPKEPFAPEELGALKRYVERGGALLLALDPDSGSDELERSRPAAVASSSTSNGASSSTPAKPPRSDSKTAPAGPGQVSSAMPLTHKDTGAELVAALAGGGPVPNLNALAAIAGLSIEPSILANDKGDSVSFAGNKSDRTRIVTNRFGSHASVSTLSRHSAWVVLFGTGSLKKLDPNDKSVDFVLRSTTTTFADANGNFEADANESRNSFDLAAAVTRKLGASTPDGKPIKSGEQRLFVIADADLFTDLVLKNVPTNRFLLLDAVRWLGGEESLSGEVNSEEDVRIEHTKGKDVVWFYATILGVPLLILGLGLAWSRRTRGQGGHR